MSVYNFVCLVIVLLYKHLYLQIQKILNDFKMKKITLLLTAALWVGMLVQGANAQNHTSTTGANTITTGVPFLTIAPDSRAGAMGGCRCGNLTRCKLSALESCKICFC